MLPQNGFSPEICLDFDLSVIDFYDWFEARAREKKPVPEGKKLSPGMTLGPRYTDIEDIFALYRPPSDDALADAILDEEEIEGLLVYLDETTEASF